MTIDRHNIKSLAEKSKGRGHPHPLPSPLLALNFGIMIFEADIASAFRRFSLLERTERMLTFPVLSDLHVILEDIDTSEPGLRNSLNAIQALHQADELFHFDFFADLGDTGLELPHNEGDEARERLLNAYSEAHHCTAKPSIICIGNHDFDHGRLTAEEFGARMNRPNLERGHILHFGEDSSYGYYDLDRQRVRVFFLNTGNGNPYGMDDSQLAFLEQNLLCLQQDWRALFLMHACPHRNGHSARVPYRNPSFARFGEIVSQSPCSAGILCGDSHFDNEFSFGKAPGVLTQGYGGATGNDLPPGGRIHRFDSARTMLAEIVVLRPELRRIDVLRMGIDDKASDRTLHTP